MITWDDIDDILYDGAKEDIQALTCPDCGGGVISYKFDENINHFLCNARDVDI